MWFVLSVVFVQLVFFVSVFDIHFQSPIVHGMTPFASSIQAPAKRLVLFSADGLRADTFLSVGNDRQPNAPFLKSVASSRGKWGVSHTRVPTESRPGHVAMAAGLYEDPSAVFKGWKENPVEFDSVFNESRYTYAWGSPDILPMFSKGSRGNVFTHTYSSEIEEFTGHDAYKLDEWVFEQFERFVDIAAHNQTLTEMLNQNGIVFFFHLLGLDTNGHVNKPDSTMYTDNLRYVDRGVAKIESLVNRFFGDNETAFIFTSDHGMTDWGSHGAGHATETETPLVAWGAGVDTSSTGLPEWEHRRLDVEQADIAPLMSALLGINFPMNSVGKLPLEYLTDDLLFRSHAMLANAQQLRASFQSLSQRQQQRSLWWRFYPFAPLDDNLGEDHIREIKSYIRTGLYEESVAKSRHLMNLCIQGKEYFYRYDQFELKACISLAYFGWTSVLLIFLVQNGFTQQNWLSCVKKRFKIQPVDKIMILIASVVFIILTMEKASPLYYVYHWLPLSLWWYVIRQRSALKQLKLRKVHLVWVSILLAGVQLLVAAFFHRWFLSVGLGFLALWPVLNGATRRSQQQHLIVIWALNCIVLTFFPVLPPVGRHSLPTLVDIGGIALTVMAIWGSLVMHHDRDRTVLVSYTLALPLALYVRHSVHESLIQGQGLAWLDQTLAWLLLGLPLTLPLIGPSKMWPRLIGIGVTLAPSLLLLSQSYETIFYVCLLSTAAAWVHLESGVVPTPWQQIRLSYFFLFLTLLSFFGLGNVASVNSFDPNSVRCFVTTFSPFVMGALLMWKVLIPFVVVSTALWSITVENRTSMRSVYLLILLLSGVMGLQFFHWVTPIGSWLDIGTSISHYVIVQCTVVFVMLLHSLVKLLTYGPVYFRGYTKYDKD